MFKKSISKIILITIFTSCFSSLANATVPGPYVGGQLGVGETYYETFSVFNTNENALAGRIFTGYQFNPNFALELGYLQFGKTTVTDDVTGARASVTENSIDIMAKGILPLNEKFNLYGKLGAAYVTAKTTYMPYDSFFTGETYHTVAPAAAIGISYDIKPNLPVDLSLMHIQPTSSTNIDPATFLSLGISYHFDA